MHPAQAAQLSGTGYVVFRRFLEAPLELGTALDALVRDARALEQRLGTLMPGRALELLSSSYTSAAETRASHLEAGDVLLGTCLCLDACSAANGRLFGWKGSHTVAGKPRQADYVRQDDYTRDLAIALVNARLAPHFIDLEAGDLLVWAGGFVHGEAPAAAPSAPRRSLVFHFGGAR